MEKISFSLLQIIEETKTSGERFVHPDISFFNLLEEEEYSLHQDFVDWERRQDMYERLGIDLSDEPSDEWEDGVPPEIQKLVDWYKHN